MSSAAFDGPLATLAAAAAAIGCGDYTPAQPVAVAHGLTLATSAKSPTGFKGVGYRPTTSSLKPYVATGPRPEKRSLGCYATAVEAAVAVAKATEGAEAFEAWRRASGEAEAAAVVSKAGVVSTHRASGLKLFVSGRSLTGYQGVSFDNSASYTPKGKAGGGALPRVKPFKARGPDGASLGYYASAEDAALAFARHVARFIHAGGARAGPAGELTSGVQA